MTVKSIIEDYLLRVRRAAHIRNGAPISNSSADHTAVVISTFFSVADKTVKILSGDLNSRVYGRQEILNETRKFLGGKVRGEQGRVEMKVLVECDISSLAGNPFYDLIMQYKNVQIRSVPTEIQSHYNFHLMTMDGNSYRYEENRERHEAIAAFGDPENTRHLDKLFDELWERSKQGQKEAA